MELTKSQWMARAEAYLEAAEHLELSWTDDNDEFAQGKVVSERLKKEADKCFAKAK